jgi:hypothetical protein
MMLLRCWLARTGRNPPGSLLAARQALAAPDPWDGFAGFVERICELQAGDRGLSDLLSMTLSADEQVEELRRTANELLGTVIDRAKAAGTLREDFVGEDLVLLLIATAAVMHVTRADGLRCPLSVC